MRSLAFVLSFVALATGCAPTLVMGAMPNPARVTDKIESAQTYEIGPYKENHQYELTLDEWTPSSIGLRVKLTNIDQCADPTKFTFTLVDDHGMKSGLRANTPTSEKQQGKVNQTVTVTTMTGVFPIAIGKESQSVVVQVRPTKNVICPSLDFKWTLQ